MPTQQMTPVPVLTPDRVYSWEELGELFGFDPQYFRTVGGMASRPAMGACLLIHRSAERSVAYENFWDDEGDLHYAGKGPSGDQKLDRENKIVATNAATLLVFEAAGPQKLRYRGEASCIDYRWETTEGADGIARKSLRFRLRFDVAAAPTTVSAVEGGHRWVLHRRIERSRRVIVAAKRAWLAADPNLPCEACGFSFVKAYGDAAGDYIEAHHRVPLSALKGTPKETTPADLAPLCANCHRVLHLQPDLTVDALRQRLRP